MLWWVLQGLAISAVAYGTRLRLKFQNGSECEMTYSRRQFIACPGPNSLYKFVDVRDPRHRGLLNQKLPAAEQFCNRQRKVVFYIPGHWGSFSQCRSLGAHGVQLTRQSESREHELKVCFITCGANSRKVLSPSCSMFTAWTSGNREVVSMVVS